MNGASRTTSGEGQRARLSLVVPRSALVALLVLTSTFRLLTFSPSAQDPVFRSGASELVVLPVVVTDRNGRYVSDLPAEHFVVWDNGRRVPIELFTNEDTPVTVGLLIDASSSMQTKIGEVIAASLAFARSSNPQDELFAIRFNDDVKDMIPDRPFLLAEDHDALQTAVTAIRPSGRTALYDGMLAAFDHLTHGSRARKVLIVISDGGDTGSQATLDDVLARAHRSNAAVYTIGIYDNDDLDKNPGVLKTIARATGGERFLPRSPGDLLTACERIAREVRGGYTIGYAPPARDGAFHRVKVDVTSPSARGVNVRTRPGYFAAGRPAQP